MLKVNAQYDMRMRFLVVNSWMIMEIVFKGFLCQLFLFKGTTKLSKIIFLSATIIGENTTNILKCCFPKEIYIL